MTTALEVPPVLSARLITAVDDLGIYLDRQGGAAAAAAAEAPKGLTGSLLGSLKPVEIGDGTVSAKVKARNQRAQSARLRREMSLRDELSRELERRRDSPGADKVTAFASFIQQAVVLNWSRPASARNGMSAELSIQMEPDGTIAGVEVIRSSGDSRFFDASAVRAVWRVRRIAQISTLDKETFETYFRRFRLLFRPEDLTK